MLKLLDLKAWLIIILASIAAIGGSYALGYRKGDSVGSARETAAWTAKTLEATQQHGRQLAAREAEKRALQDKVNAAEIQRQVTSQEQLLKLYPDPKDTSAPVYLPPAMRKVLEGLAK